MPYNAIFTTETNLIIRYVFYFMFSLIFKVFVMFVTFLLFQSNLYIVLAPAKGPENSVYIDLFHKKTFKKPLSSGCVSRALQFMDRPSAELIFPNASKASSSQNFYLIPWFFPIWIFHSLFTCKENRTYLVTFPCGCIINTFSFMVRMTTHADCETVEKLVSFTGKQWWTFNEVRPKKIRINNHK